MVKGARVRYYAPNEAAREIRWRRAELGYRYPRRGCSHNCGARPRAAVGSCGSLIRAVSASYAIACRWRSRVGVVDGRFGVQSALFLVILLGPGVFVVDV